MYAECCLEADNDEAKAKKYIQMVRDRANHNTETYNTTQADAGKSYLKGGTLPTVDELLQQKPVVGRVEGSNGDVICEGMELNSVRRILKHEYSVELYWIMLDNLKNKNALQVEQTNLTGTQVFDYSRHLRLPIPSTELSTNTNMHGNSAN